MFEVNSDAQLRMPVENLTVSFRPQSFFKINPSLDVPEAKDPESVLASNGQNRSSCH